MKAGSLVVLLALLAGCASNSGIVKISPDTYILARQDKAGIFGDASAMKVDVLREANEFAEKLGKVAIPLATHEVPAGPGRFATIEYQFRVVDPSDKEAQRTSLVPRANVVIEKKESIDIKTKDDSSANKRKDRDVYSELIKLDDLRKRGVLTEAEFAQQKQRLLESN